MRVLEIGTKKYTEVRVLDEKGQGNANHHYSIGPIVPAQDNEVSWCLPIKFQNGPIKEAGVNGVMNEDLLAILIDRMRGFQSGDYACDANKHALYYLENALTALRERTDEREARGVEGTHEK